jgi:hypothetical protein
MARPGVAVCARECAAGSVDPDYGRPLRGQTIVGINRNQFENDPTGPTGQAVRYTPRKNRKKVRSIRLPVMPELQAFIADLKVQRADGLIAIRNDGSAWPSEKGMQTRVSHWLRRPGVQPGKTGREH